MEEKQGLGTRFDEAGESTGLALWQVTNRWQVAQRAALRPFGLTHVQFVLLASLTWLESSEDLPVSQRRLAEHAGADTMMTSQVVRGLAARGLLCREPSPGDRRALALTVTPDGRDLVNRAVVVIERVDDDHFGVLGHERGAFTEMLRRLIDAPQHR